MSTDRRYGPDVPCQRNPCTSDGTRAADHNGGAHLDPTSDLYDGPDLLLGVMPLSCRDAMRALYRASEAHARTDTAPPPSHRMVLVALDAAGREIERLRQQVAHVRVDADHKIREAMARSGECQHHGEEIKSLNESLHRWAADRDRVEKARLALLGEHQAVSDLIDAYDAPDRQRQVTADDLADYLRSAHKRAGSAHNRAFHAPLPKES